MITKFLLFLLLIILAICQKAFCQQKQEGLIHKIAVIETDPVFYEFVGIRRDLHQNPKLE